MNRQFRNAAVKSLDERRPREIRNNCTIETARVYFKRVDKHTRLGVRLAFFTYTRLGTFFEVQNIFHRAFVGFVALVPSKLSSLGSQYRIVFVYRWSWRINYLEGGVNNCKYQDFCGMMFDRGFLSLMVWYCRYETTKNYRFLFVTK